MYEKYQQLLEKRGITSYKVAKEIGIAQSTLSDWKSGRSTPKLDKLLKIANYFRVPLEYFIEGVDTNVRN